MLAKTFSCNVLGVDGYIVEVEIDISNGLPSFDIVGLPDTSVKEAKERVRAALKNSGYEFPLKRITINLAPASTKKEGSAFDLPIALGILAATEQVNINLLKDFILIGELSLSGEIKRINGVLPMALAAKKMTNRIALPIENATESSVVTDLKVYPFKTLKEVVDFMNFKLNKEPFIMNDYSKKKKKDEELDFNQVKGQHMVKRAFEISAAGGHNILLIGPPGSGKTMLAERLPTIMPLMTLEESLEVTKIYSIAGFLSKNNPLIIERPFRSPHHTITITGLAGGGKIPKPGEISLAHNGVLFLDEMPEFKKEIIEILRQPLENDQITISRLNTILTFPSKILLVCALNPCKCGYLNDSSKECKCSPSEIQRYRRKISGPILDRIDLQVEVQRVKYDDLNNLSREESSTDIRKRIESAQNLQIERNSSKVKYFNSQLTHNGIAKFCKLDSESKSLLKSMYEKLGLTARGYTSILKLSRTIADLEGSGHIEMEHIAEAIQFRKFDRNIY